MAYELAEQKPKHSLTWDFLSSYQLWYSNTKLYLEVEAEEVLHHLLLLEEELEQHAEPAGREDARRVAVVVRVGVEAVERIHFLQEGGALQDQEKIW